MRQYLIVVLSVVSILCMNSVALWAAQPVSTSNLGKATAAKISSPPKAATQPKQIPIQNKKFQEDIAQINKLLSSLDDLEDKAERLTAKFNLVYSQLVNAKINEMTDEIFDQVFKDKQTGNIGKTKSAGFLEKVKNYFTVQNKVQKSAEPVLINPNEEFVESPWGKIKMSANMKNILKEIEPIEAEIDGQLSEALKLVNNVPYLNGARLISRQMQVNLRRNFRTLHTEVFGLSDVPVCAGDIAADGYVLGYLDNFLTGNYPKALEYLYVFVNQMTCISARQAKGLDYFLHEAYEKAMRTYIVQGKNVLQNGTKALVDAALYNLALIVYDLNKATFSVWQSWFCENGYEIISQYKPGKPLYIFGIWLYDKVDGSIGSFTFKPDDGSIKFQCDAVQKPVIVNGLSYYGSDLAAMSQTQCDESGSPIDTPVAPKDLSFTELGVKIVEASNINYGQTGFVATAAIGVPDTFGLCGGSSGPGGVGGTVNCSMSAGEGKVSAGELSVQECMAPFGSWPAPSSAAGDSGAGTGFDPLPVDIAKLRQAALCGNKTGDPPDLITDTPLPPLPSTMGKTSETKYKADESHIQKENQAALDKEKAAAIETLTANAEKIFTATKKDWPNKKLSDTDKETFMTAAKKEINAAKAGSYHGSVPGSGTVGGSTDQDGNITISPGALPGGKFANTGTNELVHEAIHAGLYALGLSKESKGPMGSNPITKGAARLHHLITGDAGFGYSNYYPNPNSMDSSQCGIMAMDTFMSSANCSKTSGDKSKDWCDKLDADCMPPDVGMTNGSGGDGWGSGNGNGGGFSGNLVGDIGGGDPMPDEPKNFNNAQDGPCTLGGGPAVDISKFIKSKGVTDPSPIDKESTLSNWMIKEAGTMKPSGEKP